MRLLPRSLKWRAILLTLLGLVAVGGSVWWTFRADISAFVKRQQVLDDLRKSPLAIDQCIGGGQFHVGVSVEEWIAAHPPKSHIRHDEYDTLTYQLTVRRDSPRVIAVNGAIVFADTESGQPKNALAGNLSPDESAAYWRSFLRWQARQTVGQAAVCGIAHPASQNPWNFPAAAFDDLTEQP